jgi:hypothetical protein
MTPHLSPWNIINVFNTQCTSYSPPFACLHPSIQNFLRATEKVTMSGIDRITTSSNPAPSLDFGPDFDLESTWTHHLTKLTIIDPPSHYQSIAPSFIFIETFLNYHLLEIPTPLLDRSDSVLFDFVFSPIPAVTGCIQGLACKLLINLLAKISKRFDSTFTVRFD